MSVNGINELRSDLERIEKEAEKLGKEDGRRDSGGQPKTGANLPNWSKIHDQCEAVKAELLSSLDQSRLEAEARSKRIEGEIEEAELLKQRKQQEIEELKARREASSDAEAAGLLDVHISKEKIRLEGIERKLSDLRQKRQNAHNEALEAERQAQAAGNIYQEREDIVVKAYESSYLRHQAKKKGVLSRIFSS